MKEEDFFEDWKGDWEGRKEGRKNFIPIKPNSSYALGIDKIITELKEVLKRQSEYTFKYKKE